MEDVSVKTNISYVEGTQAGINKAGEKIGEKALGYVVDFIKKQYGNVCVETGCAFESYLYNSEVRYNKIKTLADPFDVRELEGEEGIYVDVYVNYKSKKIAVKEIGDLEKISNNIIIIGSGGTGKSIIMRHLFVDTVRKHEYIPVLVDLRKITEIEKGTELLDVIHSCIESFDVKLNQEQFEYSLRAGKYLFLLDGLDEVKRELCMQTEQLIQNMSK